MPNDNISHAMDVMIQEINAYENELISMGIRFMEKKLFEDAKKVSISGVKLKTFREKFNLLKSSWESDIDIETRSNVIIKNIKSIAPHHKGAATRLRITFSNGKIIEEKYASETFVLAIVHLGLDKVNTLNIKLNGINIISRQPHEKYSQTKVDGYYIMTHSNTEKKKQLIEKIARKIGIVVKTEIIH